MTSLKDNKLVLLGYMGSGKTTIGKLLSSTLQVQFYDLDQVIERQENSSIEQIFEKKGALYFRKLEKKLLTELIKKEESSIISLGGGTPCYYENMKLINQSSKTTSIYLNYGISILADRLFPEVYARPLLRNIKTKDELREFIGKHLFERRSFYMEAQLILNLDNKTSDEVVKTIIASLEKH